MSQTPGYQIVLGPVVTEKTTGMQEKARTLCFHVHPRANKIQIKQAIEQVFKVKVQEVRTVKVFGKLKRQGKTSGYAPDRKKAYVTLKEGEKMIEFFQGT